MHVWVVCSESHFSVLFALDQYQYQTQMGGASCSLLPKLMYYDGLANQEQPILLTLSKRDLPNAPQTLRGVDTHEEDSGGVQHQGDSPLVSPLEHVIHTKWPNVSIHWTGSDPIL